ncbi:hypothetical protein B0H66DRAFT_622940 [Apodospora peruviana]|uniref:Rhodopsin domain-containing protein n=1 Tax=Apodospora peruviana TaxID=516989 RepID=A0AAE0I578_9PEZI|nr:hypothetical protein B0H66DRAFT_622940 [Apodospora peruviana]
MNSSDGVSSNSSTQGPMMYLSTSEDGKIPATVIAIGVVFSVVAAVSVALRFYTRLHVTRFGLAVDDWLMLAALLLTLGMGVMLIVGAALHGLAQPTPQGYAPGDYFWVTDDAVILTEKVFWAFIMTQDLAFGLVKLSILFFYRRIFPSATFKVLSSILIGLVCIWTVGFLFAYMFRCGTNFWALWAPLKDLVEKCYDGTPMFYTLTISDVVTDLMILSLPWYWIWRLNMSPAKRWAVSGVFLLGFLEIGTGLARLVIFVQQTTNYLQIADGIGLLTTLMVWSMVEMGIAVLAGCLPTIWPLISKISLEDMLRTVRSVLSLHSITTSLRDLGGRASTRSSKQQHSDDDDEDKPGLFQDDSGPYLQYPTLSEDDRGCHGGIGVEKVVAVRHSPVPPEENDRPPVEGVAMRDFTVQTATRVYSGIQAKDGSCCV